MAAPLCDATALTLIFEDACNLGLSNRMRLQLALRASLNLKIFWNLTKAKMTAIFANFFKPPKVPIPGVANIAVGYLCEIHVFKVSAKSKVQLKGVMLITKFFDNVGCPLDPDNMSFPFGGKTHCAFDCNT
jgi:hypothetical protein